LSPSQPRLDGQLSTDSPGTAIVSLAADAAAASDQLKSFPN
jgi:hypothetical protein